MIYAVIDTNVFVSAFITNNKEAATSLVFQRLLAGEITPLYNEEILAEYKEVLSRKKSSGLADRLIGGVKNNQRRHPSENGAKVSTHKEGCKYAILITN